MSIFLSYTVIGVALGAIYAITATGLVVTYTTTGVFNFAHGAVAMVCAFSYWQVTQGWGWPTAAGLIVVILIEAPLLGAIVEVVLMRRIHGASTERALMVTLGLLLILVGVATAVWSPNTLRQVTPLFAGNAFQLAGVEVSWQQLITLIVAAAIAVGLRAYFKGFRPGVAMRAVVDDPELVALSGASPFWVARLGWMLGFALAAVAGILLSPTVSSTGLNIETLTLLVVSGYAAAVVGRLRNLPLTFVGALVLGLVTEYCYGYLAPHLPASWSGLTAQTQLLVPVIFLFLVLLFIPAARLVASGRLAAHLTPRVAGLGESVGGGLVVVVLAVVLSPVLTGLWMTTISQGLALGIVALSLVLLTGYGGQVSLCQLTFLGVGAFAMGKIAGGDSWLGLLAAIGICAGIGAVIALPVLRLRGLYWALATLAFGEAMYYGFFSNPSVFPGTGGAQSVGRLPLPGIPAADIGDKTELIVIAVAFALCSIIVLAIRRSSFGRRVVALNDSPAAFATLGLNATVSKVAIFAISAGMAGLGGVLYGGEQGSISANDVVFFSSLTLLLLVSIWGIRSSTGALLGGLSAAALPVAQSQLPQSLADLTGLVAGVGIILLGRSPEGVLGLPWLTERVHLPWVDRGGDHPGREDVVVPEEHAGAVG